MAKKNGNNKNNRTIKELKPQTNNQAEYVRAIAENQVILCDGPAGSGKTKIATYMACKYFLAHDVNKIIITRPALESGRGLGYLPGDFYEKIHPYLVPVLQELYYYLGMNEVNNHIKNEVIEVVPLEYMRGRNFHNSFIIGDEFQNTSIPQIKMFLSRIGRQSKCVVNGDVDQSDLIGEKNGLKYCMQRLHNIEDVALIKLCKSDIVRNPLISEILDKL